MLPILKAEDNPSKKYIINFQGLNLGEGYAEGEFSDCRNISSVLAPCITQRSARTKEARITSAIAACRFKYFLISGTENTLPIKK